MSKYDGIVQCVLPILSPKWNAEQFFSSAGNFDVPFLLIDNSPTHDSANLKLPPCVEVEWHPDNLGTSISWNLGIMRGAKWTLILSCSTRFGEGGLQAYVDEAVHWANDFGFYSPIGGHCHFVGKHLIEKIGLYDPHYLPGYGEDREHARRIDVSDIHINGSMPVFRPSGLHIVGSAIAVQSGAVKDQRIEFREAYHKRKWGGEQCKETFTTPYGIPDAPLWYMEEPVFIKDISVDVYESAMRAINWYKQEVHNY